MCGRRCGALEPMSRAAAQAARGSARRAGPARRILLAARGRSPVRSRRGARRVRRRACRAAGCITPGCWSDPKASARRRSPIVSPARCWPRASRMRRASADRPPIIPCSARWRRSSHPNLLLIRRSWNDKTKRYSQWIGVDEVRRLRNFLGHSAGETGWRVVIVDRADELNQNAANALLKALEEPPPRTLFLLMASAEGRHSRHHPLPLPDASRHGFGRGGSGEGRAGGARARRARGRCQDACHRRSR